MKIVKDDIWDYLEKGYHIVVPTNGWVNKSGEAAMGRGVAFQAKKLYKNLSNAVGNLITKHGNKVFHFPNQKIVIFPTKVHWKGDASIDLIAESLKSLKVLLEKNPELKVAMPKIGCGNGRLQWNDVSQVINEIIGKYKDRWIIVDNEQGDTQEYFGKNKENKRGTGGQLEIITDYGDGRPAHRVIRPTGM